MNEDVEWTRTKDGILVTFKRMYYTSFLMPNDQSDVNEFIKKARPMAEDAFAKLTASPTRGEI